MLKILPDELKKISSDALCVTDDTQCVTDDTQCVTDDTQCVTDDTQCVTDDTQCVTDMLHSPSPVRPNVDCALPKRESWALPVFFNFFNNKK